MLGVKNKGTLGDMDALDKVPFKRARDIDALDKVPF